MKRSSLAGLELRVQLAKPHSQDVHRLKLRAVCQLNRYLGLLAFRDHVRQKQTKQLAAAVCVERPLPLRLTTQATQLPFYESAREKALNVFDGWLMAHLHFDVNILPFRKARPDCAFAVNDSCEPRFFEFGHKEALLPGLDTGSGNLADSSFYCAVTGPSWLDATASASPVRELYFQPTQLSVRVLTCFHAAESREEV